MRLLDRHDMSFTPLAGDAPHGRLSIGAHAAVISGTRIEAVYALEHGDPIRGYLSFASDDILYEDVLSVTLTDPNLSILDQAYIGAPYDTALWDGGAISGPGQIDFQLDERGAWRLTVLSRPEWRLPLPSSDGWIWRGMSLRRHFRIDRIGTD